MDRVVWQATVHRAAESDTTEVTQHTGTCVALSDSVWTWVQTNPIFLEYLPFDHYTLENNVRLAGFLGKGGPKFI